MVMVVMVSVVMRWLMRVVSRVMFFRRRRVFVWRRLMMMMMVMRSVQVDLMMNICTPAVNCVRKGGSVGCRVTMMTGMMATLRFHQTKQNLRGGERNENLLRGLKKIMTNEPWIDVRNKLHDDDELTNNPNVRFFSLSDLCFVLFTNFWPFFQHIFSLFSLIFHATFHTHFTKSLIL